MLNGALKQFGDLTVLADVSLALSTHEVLAVVRPARDWQVDTPSMHQLLEPVDDGEILLDGVDIADPESTPTTLVGASASCSNRSSCSLTSRSSTTIRALGDESLVDALDEPPSALDLELVAEVLDAIRTGR